MAFRGKIIWSRGLALAWNPSMNSPPSRIGTSTLVLIAHVMALASPIVPASSAHPETGSPDAPASSPAGTGRFASAASRVGLQDDDAQAGASPSLASGTFRPQFLDLRLERRAFRRHAWAGLELLDPAAGA